MPLLILLLWTESDYHICHLPGHNIDKIYNQSTFVYNNWTVINSPYKGKDKQSLGITKLDYPSSIAELQILFEELEFKWCSSIVRALNSNIPLWEKYGLADFLWEKFNEEMQHLDVFPLIQNNLEQFYSSMDMVSMIAHRDQKVLNNTITMDEPKSIMHMMHRIMQNEEPWEMRVIKYRKELIVILICFNCIRFIFL